MEKLASNLEVIEKVEELVKLIKEDSRYKHYLDLRAKLSSDEEVMLKMDKIKRLQKEYVRGAYLDAKVKDDINTLERELNKLPLYREYLIAENDINNILSTIKTGINVTIFNLLNKK